MRKSVDEMLLDIERKERLKREADRAETLTSKLNCIINELGEYHVASYPLREAIKLLGAR
jgi:hypothetical protein